MKNNIAILNTQKPVGGSLLLNQLFRQLPTPKPTDPKVKPNSY